MNVPTAKRLVLVVSSLAASLAFVFGQYPPESDGAVHPLPSEAKGQAVPEILALRIGAKNYIVDEVIAGRLSLVQAPGGKENSSDLNRMFQSFKIAAACPLRIKACSLNTGGRKKKSRWPLALCPNHLTCTAHLPWSSGGWPPRIGLLYSAR